MKEPKFELFTDAAGEWRFRLKAPNGEVIAQSEGYETQQGAKNGILSVQTNAPKANTYLVAGETTEKATDAPTAPEVNEEENDAVPGAPEPTEPETPQAPPAPQVPATPSGPAPEQPVDEQANANAGEPEENKDDQPEMIDHVVTQEDLDNNLDLVREGVKVGDTIQIPKEVEEKPLVFSEMKNAEIEQWILDNGGDKPPAGSKKANLIELAEALLASKNAE